MKPHEQQRAIALSCGWKDQGEQHEEYRWIPPPPHDWPRTWRNKPVYPPDYLHDLNAMHEAEKMLTGGLLQGSTMYKYTRLLHELTAGMGHLATSQQRAEAFLKAFDLWTESNDLRNIQQTSR